MRFVFIVCAISFGLSVPALAYENFIPLGAGYSTDVSSLPALNSQAQANTSQADIYETELYRKQLEQRQHDSYITRFYANSDASDFSVDY